MTDHSITPQAGQLSITGHAPVVLVLGELTLDVSGRFYPYMLTFLVASAGLTPIYDAATYPEFMAGTSGIFPAKSIGTQVDLGRCVAAVRSGALSQQRAEILLSGMLANSAYESLTDAERHVLSGDPIFEFLLHVRNAASHANKWFFKKTSPKYRASWKELVIDEKMKGESNPLHGKQCIHGSISPGDVLLLLREVEKLLPEMRGTS